MQGKEIIEHFVKELKDEGITYVEPWTDPKEKSPVKDEKRYYNVILDKYFLTIFIINWFNFDKIIRKVCKINYVSLTSIVNHCFRSLVEEKDEKPKLAEQYSLEGKLPNNRGKKML